MTSSSVLDIVIYHPFVGFRHYSSSHSKFAISHESSWYCITPWRTWLHHHSSSTLNELSTRKPSTLLRTNISHPKGNWEDEFPEFPFPLVRYVSSLKGKPSSHLPISTSRPQGPPTAIGIDNLLRFRSSGWEESEPQAPSWCQASGFLKIKLSIWKVALPKTNIAHEKKAGAMIVLGRVSKCFVIFSSTLANFKYSAVHELPSCKRVASMTNHPSCPCH